MAKKKLEDRHGSLTLIDRFYIEEHGNTTVDELVALLGKPKEDVESYVNELGKKFKKTQKPKAHSLMDRPSKGVTTMTAGASQAGDDSKYKNLVTTEAIQQAIADEDFDAASRLKARYDQQQSENKNVIKKSYKDSIFHINPIDEDEDVY